MRPHCELMATKLFPQIRALIAEELTENLGFTQAETAYKMGITQPAISQYKKEFRASEKTIIESDPCLMRTIKAAAKKLATAKTPRNSGILCDICKQIRAQNQKKIFKTNH